jgi:hypothetical protein
MAIAVCRAALKRAMLPIPTVGAQARTIGADSVSGTSRITSLHSAVFASPALVTDTDTSFTVAPRSTVKITHLNSTIIAGESSVADALPQFRFEAPVARAVWKALFFIVIHLVAIGSTPSLPADTCSGHTEAMSRAAGVLTVHLLTRIASVTSATLAFPVETVPVVVAVGHLAFIMSYGALGALPTRVATTGSLLVLTV